MHVLFMQDDKDHYIDELFAKPKGSAGSTVGQTAAA
jgi:hypothetical protein